MFRRFTPLGHAINGREASRECMERLPKYLNSISRFGDPASALRWEHLSSPSKACAETSSKSCRTLRYKLCKRRLARPSVFHKSEAFPCLLNSSLRFVVGNVQEFPTTIVPPTPFYRAQLHHPLDLTVTSGAPVTAFTAISYHQASPGTARVAAPPSVQRFSRDGGSRSPTLVTPAVCACRGCIRVFAEVV